MNSQIDDLPGRARVFRRVGAAAAALLVGVPGCSRDAPEPAPTLTRTAQTRSEPAPQAGTPDGAAAALYVKHCAACHGAEGHGDGPAAEQLFPKPRAFMDSPFRFAATGGTKEEMVRAVEATITRGMPRSAMPGFGAVLSSEEIGDLARYVVSLVGDAAAPAQAGADMPPPTPMPDFNRALVRTAPRSTARWRA
jgi:mono/diheme cytochrome c family protein